MSSIADWAERVLRTVEGDGAHVHKVRLLTVHDGQTWETWFAPFPPASEWVIQCESYLRSLENEFPARALSLLLIAETKSGETLSQLPHKITGKARAGQMDSAAQAQAVAFDQIALTVEKLLRLTGTQLDASRRIAETNAVTIQQQTELIRLYREREVAGTGEPGGFEQLMRENAPQLLELGGAYLAQVLSKKTPGTKDN